MSTDHTSGPLPFFPARALHASCVVLGESGVLIRGPSGAGKSRLALMLIEEARRRGEFASWLADDRVLLRRAGARLVASPHPSIAGRFELRGLGIMEAPCEPKAVVRLVVDLRADVERMPPARDLSTVVAGVRLKCLPLVAGPAGLYEVRLVLTMLRMRHEDEDGLTSVPEAGRGIV